MTTTKTKQGGRVVFTATHDWWEIVSRDEEIATGDAWPAGYEAAAAIAGTNLDDEESWVCRVVGDTGRHAAIKAGDYVCCDGYGSDVVFVRLS